MAANNLVSDYLTDAGHTAFSAFDGLEALKNSLSATLQLANEAKEAGHRIWPFTLLLSLLLAAIFALLYSRWNVYKANMEPM